jgi:transposase
MSPKVAGQFLRLPTLNLPEAMPRRPNQNAAKPLIAPQPCLPGTSGAVGLDVSKASFHACYLSDSKARPQTGVFTADAAGHAKFLAWLDRVGTRQSLHLCLEETGCYGRALASFLHQAGHHVSIVNAALIKNYGRSLNLRTKNDRVDAQLIAGYTLERIPDRWQPLAPQHQALRDAARRRQQLMGLLLQEKNHLEASPSPAIREHIQQTIDILQARLTLLETHMDTLIDTDAHLKHNAALLVSIPGIGKLTAKLLLAELPPLDSFNSARQLSAYAGLTPREHQSGTSVNGRPRLCKQGRGGLRKLFFMPAVSLMGSKTGPLRQFADRLLGAAKKPACVVGALMRKLSALVFAILRSGKPFDPNYARTMAVTATPK